MAAYSQSHPQVTKDPDVAGVMANIGKTVLELGQLTTGQGSNPEGRKGTRPQRFLSRDTVTRVKRQVINWK